MVKIISPLSFGGICHYTQVPRAAVLNSASTLTPRPFFSLEDCRTQVFDPVP